MNIRELKDNKDLHIMQKNEKMVTHLVHCRRELRKSRQSDATRAGYQRPAP